MRMIFAPYNAHDVVCFCAPGVTFAQVFAHATADQLTVQVAKAIFPSFLKMLVTLKKDISTFETDPAKAGATSAAGAQATGERYRKLKGTLFAVMGALAARHPVLVNSSAQLAKLFFGALSASNEGPDADEDIRQSIMDGLHSLRTAYRTMSPAVAEELRTCLLALADDVATDRRVRVRALQWLNRLFPFSDVACRYACVVHSVNSPNDVRDEALKGLELSNEFDSVDYDLPFATRLSSASASASAMDTDGDSKSAPSLPTDEEEVDKDWLDQSRLALKCPAFPDFVYVTFPTSVKICRTFWTLWTEPLLHCLYVGVFPGSMLPTNSPAIHHLRVGTTHYCNSKLFCLGVKRWNNRLAGITLKSARLVRRTRLHADRRVTCTRNELT